MIEKPKKSLGQNFLIDKNIIKKILVLSDLKNRHVVEIGPGRGALTDKILKYNPRSLTIIEKDFKLSKFLKEKYLGNKILKIYNNDILKFNLSFVATFLNLFLTLNLFLFLVFNFIISFYPLFLKRIDLFLLFLFLCKALFF